MAEEPVTWLPSRSPPDVERPRSLPTRLVTGLFADLLSGEAEPFGVDRGLTPGERRAARRRRTKRDDAVNQFIIIAVRCLTVVVVVLTIDAIAVLITLAALWIRAMMGDVTPPVGPWTAVSLTGFWLTVPLLFRRLWHRFRAAAIRRLAAKP
jgi:hypothetical protein